MQENGKLALKSIRIPDSRIWMSFIDHFSFVVYKTTMGHLHCGILLSHKKENLILCDSMDGPGEHYAE